MVLRILNAIFMAACVVPGYILSPFVSRYFTQIRESPLPLLEDLADSGRQFFEDVIEILLSEFIVLGVLKELCSAPLVEFWEF